MIQRRTTNLETFASRSLQRVSVRAMRWVTCGWMLGMFVVASGFAASGHWDLLPDACLISSGCLAITLASMIPGWLAGRAEVSAERTGEEVTHAAATRQANSVVGALFVGMAIRSVGTVALFLTCRYQLASSTETIAAMTIGWYVFLTSIEVFAFARALPKTAQNPNFPETSLG